MAIKKADASNRYLVIPYGLTCLPRIEGLALFTRGITSRQVFFGCVCITDVILSGVSNNIAPYAYCCKCYFIETISVYNGTKKSHLLLDALKQCGFCVRCL